MQDGMLAHLRDTYPIETAWAPAWAGDELRQARTGAWDARLAALRAAAEAAAATRQARHDDAERHRDLAASYQAMQDAYQQREVVLAATMADRAIWEEATRQKRQLAIAADAELRCRHLDQHHPPLRSGEPEPLTHDEPASSAEDDMKRTGQLIAELTAQRREFARQYAQRTCQPLPSETSADVGVTPTWSGSAKDAILQAPKPHIEPSPRILERVTSRDLDLEAAD